MRIHIINTIIASGYTPDTNDTFEDSPDVVLIHRTRICQPNLGNHTTPDTDSTPTTPAEPHKPGPLAPPFPSLTTLHT